MSRKSVLWLMAGALVISAAAMAEDMPCKIYGVAHVSTDLLNNGDQSEVFISSNTTRVGIVGSMATGNDLFTVIYQWENQVDFNLNAGSDEKSAWANRNSYAGVKGEWGKFILGRYDTPFKTIGRQVEFFPERLGDARNATRLDWVGNGWDERPTNMMMYWTPQLAECFTVAAQFVPDQGVDGGQAFSASGLYDKEGLKAGLAVEVHGKALEAAFNNGPYIAAGNEPQSATGIRGMVRYQGEEFAVGGMLQSISNFAGYDGISSLTWGLGGSYLVTPEWEAKAQFYLVDPNTDADDDGGQLLTAGVDYILSKQARLYLVYATAMNQDAANYFTPFAGGHGQAMPLTDIEAPFGTADPGLSPYGLSAGLTVAF